MEFKEEKKFSFIVPVHDVPNDVFRRCLDSILDQDYPNIEVIIVPNGGDTRSEKIAREYAKSKKSWSVIPIKEKGACNARNQGFKHSSGEVVSFFNSDYIAHRGMVRMWIDAMDKHGADFVYGAYEYRVMTKSVYWSKEFDRYSLEVANFIDCGFPLKREFVVKWDDKVKSLQDWDFWLGVVKKGAKPHFLGREISFVAEPPRRSGLSEDSHKNWIDRVNFIKKKHGIEIRDICVTSFGAPNHGLNIAKTLGADYRDDTLFKPNQYKALYLIGFYMRHGQQGNPHADALRWFDRPDCQRIVHFVGADIFWLKSFPWSSLKAVSAAINTLSTSVLCENELAQAELKELGIRAEIVPIPPYTDLEIKPLPEDFSVALYLTDKSDFDKYLQKHTLSIVTAMPDIQFFGYGDADLSGFKAENFRHCGTMTKTEWAEFVYQRSAYLRIVRHDTRPMASDEFVIAGRSVITNIPNEHMDYVDTSGNLEIDKWDHFAPGISVLRWPETKKKLIQKIREVKAAQAKNDNVFQAERLAKSIALRTELNKETYRERVKTLSCGLEAVHA